MKKEWRKTPPPLWLSTDRRYIYTPLCFAKQNIGEVARSDGGV